MEPVMFPHPLDRYRLVQLLVEGLRLERKDDEGKALRQQRVAALAEVSPSTVSQLENLANYAPAVRGAEDSADQLESQTRRPTRRQILRILNWGLSADRDFNEAIVWLLGQEPLTLTPEEVSRYNLGPCTLDETDFPHPRRKYVVDRLERRLPEGGLRTTVRVFSSYEAGRAGGAKAVLELERESGQRLLLSSRPSHLVVPEERFRERIFTVDEGEIAEELQSEVHSRDERMALFKRNLKSYGERSIHSRTQIEEGLMPKGEQRQHIAARREQVENLINLLDARDEEGRPINRIEVGLSDKTPFLEHEIKAGLCAVVRGARPAWSDESMWGPHYIAFDDVFGSLPFYIFFERRWMDLKPDERTRADVIAWLREAVEKSRRDE